jgi:hypothetical protein
MLRRLGIPLLLLLCGLSANAAERPGSISGFVRTPSGVPQMGAIVEVFRSVSHSVTAFTDERGFYSVVGLVPGIYNVRASAPSFLPAVRERISVRSDASSVVNLSLTTIFNALQLTPRTPTAEQDDWKWMLRSAANRPILRVLQPAPVSESDDSGLRTSLYFAAGSGSAGYGSSPDMSTRFTLEHSVLSNGKLTLGGNVGYGPSPLSAVVQATFSQDYGNGSRPEITLTARRFASAGPFLPDSTLSSVALTAADSLTLGNVIELHFGSELQTMQFMRRASAVLPFGEAAWHLSPNTVLEYRYSSQQPSARLSKDIGPLPMEQYEVSPRVSVDGFTPALERAHHHELSVSRRIGKTSLQLAAFYDRLGDPALIGVGEVRSLNGDILPDPYSGTFTYQGRDFSASGFRAVMQRKLTGDLTGSLDYSMGDVLELPDPGTALASAQDRMRTVKGQALAGRISGLTQRSHTRWTASYRWTSVRALTPVDSFNVSAGQAEPFMNVAVRQPVPTLGFLPGHLEAVLDLRNLLKQGYVPVVAQDGHTVYLVQSARAIRGGLAFTF